MALGLTEAVLAQSSNPSASKTQTSLTAETSEVGGHTMAVFSATVLGEDGTPATGAVTLTEGSRSLSAATLDTAGHVQIKLDGLLAGSHILRAVYSGDSAHAASQSDSVTVQPDATAPDFTLSLTETTVNIASPGQAGDLQAVITPVGGFTGFISLSCYGVGSTTTLPVGVSCTFAPSNLQVIAPTTANPTGAATTDLTVITSAPQARIQAPNHLRSASSPLVLAVLFPGALGLGLLARRRKLFGNTAFLLLIGSMALISASGCSARYRYLNHGPTFGGTAVGSYTIAVTAQTSNGVTASSHTQTFVLAVK